MGCGGVGLGGVGLGWGGVELDVIGWDGMGWNSNEVGLERVECGGVGTDQADYVR